MTLLRGGMNMEKLKVAIYCRVGRKESSNEDLTIEMQKHTVNQYLKDKVKEIQSKEYYIDNGFSGTNYDRPEFRRMIQDVEEKRINTIIVQDLVRFGRTNNTLDRIEALKRKYGVNFISIIEEIDTINNMNEFNQIRLIQKCIKDSFNESIRLNRKFRSNKVRLEGSKID